MSINKNLLLLLLLAASTPLLAAPKSLFVQTSSIPVGSNEWKTREWFQSVCDDHRTRGSNNYIYNLVLQTTADSDGNLYTQQLDIIDDYFHCFDNVFLGTAIVPWTGDGSQYIEGIVDSGYRWANIYLSRDVANKLLQRYSSQVFYWYIPYEANLSYFIGSNINGTGISGTKIKNAYKALLKQLANDLYAKSPRDVMWSPAFWTNYDSLSVSERSQLISSLVDLFNSASRVTWVHFQDGVGKKSRMYCSENYPCMPWTPVTYLRDCTDAVNYYHLLKIVANSVSTIESLDVNMEMFVKQYTVHSDGTYSFKAILPGDPQEISAREQCYSDNNVPIGASWEIRWWYLSSYATPTVTWKYPEQ